MIRGVTGSNPAPAVPLQSPAQSRVANGEQFHGDDITSHREASGKPALPLPLTSGIVLMRHAAPSSLALSRSLPLCLVLFPSAALPRSCSVSESLLDQGHPTVPAAAAL